LSIPRPHECSAANALPLEEPSSRTIIVLVADDPARLPATIRSRCQRFEIKLPGQAEACAWLERSGLDASLARRVLDASLGNPGLALQASQQGVLELKASCRSDLQALGQGRAQALQIAENWVADRPDTPPLIAREESERAWQRR
jgi:DNA polymerase-3 subunit delta'